MVDQNAAGSAVGSVGRFAAKSIGTLGAVARFAVDALAGLSAAATAVAAIATAAVLAHIRRGHSVGALAATAAVAVAGPAAGPAAEVEEKTEFDCILKDVGPEKIKVIKTVRELTGLGLKEAKDLVDNAPKPIKEGLPKEECDKIVAMFKEVGATIEVK